MSLLADTNTMAEKIQVFLEMIKFEHTVFALPFAYLGMVLAAQGWPGFSTFFWVTLAMVGARTAGMCFNRLIDLPLDALNPRTQNRALVTGTFSKEHTVLIAILGITLLLIAADQLNPYAFFLSPLAVFLLFGYSFSKRFTSASHLVLGLVLACAPIGGWIAVSGSLAVTPFLLGLAVLFWVAGFDILYALQDVEIDRKQGLYSIPSRFGTPNALIVSALFHLFTWLFLVGVGSVNQLGTWYYLGCLGFGGLLIYQHAIVSPRDFSKLNQAFFTANGFAGILVFFFTAIDLFLK